MVKKKSSSKVIVFLFCILIFGTIMGFQISNSSVNANIFKSFSLNSVNPSLITTKSTIADKDSYVDSSNPTSNYGGQDWLIFGDYITSWREAYLNFDFSDKPSEWTKAEISIDMYYISETFNITVSLIEDNWGETTITWLNKPDHGEIIANLTVSEEKIYKIDVSEFISGDGISICINASDFLQNGYVQGSSSEGYFFSEDAPQLIWTYNDILTDLMTFLPSSGNQSPVMIPGYPIGFIISLTTILFISIGLILLRKKALRMQKIKN